MPAPPGQSVGAADANARQHDRQRHGGNHVHPPGPVASVHQPHTGRGKAAIARVAKRPARPPASNEPARAACGMPDRASPKPASASAGVSRISGGRAVQPHRDAVQSDDRNDRRRCRPVPSRRRNAAAAAAKVPRRRLDCAFGAGMASLAGRLRSAPLAPATGVAGMEPGGPPGQPGDGSGGPRVGFRLVDRVMIPGQTCLGQGGVDLLVADVMNKHGRAALAALAARRQVAAALPAIRRHRAATRRADEAGSCRATASLPRAPAAAIGLAGRR